MCVFMKVIRAFTCWSVQLSPTGGILPRPFRMISSTAAGCVISGLRGQPLYTGAGGLVVGADRQTHASLIEIIGQQFTR